jgi:hypothetical protein
MQQEQELIIPFWDSSVNVVTRLGRGKRFSLHCIWDTATEYGGYSPGIKRPGHELDHSPLSHAKVKNVWSYTCISPYVVTTCGVIKHRDSCTFILHYMALMSNQFLASLIHFCNTYHKPETNFEPQLCDTSSRVTRALSRFQNCH